MHSPGDFIIKCEITKKEAFKKKKLDRGSGDRPELQSPSAAHLLRIVLVTSLHSSRLQLPHL